MFFKGGSLMRYRYYCLYFIILIFCSLPIACASEGGEKNTEQENEELILLTHKESEEESMNIETVKITDENKIKVEGIVAQKLMDQYPGAKLNLYELATYESREDHIQKQSPISSTPISNHFSFEIDLTTGERSRLYSKFIVVLNHDDNNVAVSNGHYITNPEAIAKSNFPFPKAKSKKGLQVKGDDMTGDAEELGISHAALNFSYDSMLYKDEESSKENNTIPYAFQGETFYFKKDRVENLDQEIKALSDNNVIISLILLMYYNLDEDTPNHDLIHPDHEKTENATVFALNTTNEQGVKYVSAITNFIAERYTREDEKYGRVVNFIVGNEIGQNEIWNNMGPKIVTDYVEDYARTLRLIETIVKSNYEYARTYISLDHFWNENLSDQSVWKYDNKRIVDLLSEHIRSEGDIPWNIAFHPYPEDLFEPKFWEDQSPTNDMENTPRITFKNLEVLVDYMQQEQMLYNGEMRRIILSEQGFNDRDHSIDSQKNQAAAYAYAYYKTKFLEGIDSFILHRHVDHAHEYGLNLGLWTIVDGTITTANEKKYIYDVFKYIDTEKSLEVSEFAKDIIGIDEWEEVIDNFDASELADRNLPEFVGLDFIKKPLHFEVIEDFSNGVGGWAPADNATSVEVNTSDSMDGKGSLQVNFSALENLWRGTDITFDQPLDASTKPYLNVALKVPNFSETSEYTLKVKVYNGPDYGEGIALIDPSKGWLHVALNLEDWDGIHSIDRIKIWLKSTTLNSWDGHFLIDHVALSEDIVPIGNESNFSIETDEKNNIFREKEKITIEVTNNSSSPMNGNIKVIPSDVIEFDQKQLKLKKLNPGESKLFTLTIHTFAAPEEGPIFVDFSYRGNKMTKFLGVYEKVIEKEILFDFEDHIEGWKSGENIEEIAQVDEFLNAPGIPHSGTYALGAQAKESPATSWKTIVFEPEESLSLEMATNFFYHINSYGGVPDATYETKLTLFSEADAFSTTNLMEADAWNEIRVNIADWESKDQITKIKISFRAVGNDMDWNPQFQVDTIGYEKKDLTIMQR